jgi:hypothetical protein
MSFGILSFFGSMVKGNVKLSGCKGMVCEKIIKEEDSSIGLYLILFLLGVALFIKLFD